LQKYLLPAYFPLISSQKKNTLKNKNNERAKTTKFSFWIDFSATITNNNPGPESGHFWLKPKANS